MDLYDLKTIPRRLKMLRAYRGINQTQAANMVGISRQQFNNYETGKREPNLDNIIKICNALEISLNYFSGDGPPELFDQRPRTRQKLMNLDFVETNISRDLFSICTRAFNTRARFLVHVRPMSGVTTSLREFMARTPGCYYIDSREFLEKPGACDIKLLIVDHGSYPDEDKLAGFLDDLKSFHAGLVVTAVRPVRFLLFDKDFFLPCIDLMDIEEIILKSFAFVEDVVSTDETVYRKIMMIMAGCAFDDLGRLGELKDWFAGEVVHNFSFYNLFRKLEG